MMWQGNIKKKIQTEICSNEITDFIKFKCDSGLYISLRNHLFQIIVCTLPADLTPIILLVFLVYQNTAHPCKLVTLPMLDPVQPST